MKTIRFFVGWIMFVPIYIISLFCRIVFWSWDDNSVASGGDVVESLFGKETKDAMFLNNA